MSEQGIFIPQKDTEPKKEPMSDAQIGDLLAAVGNHEGKALLLLSMKAGEPYTRPQLRELIRGQQGEREGWKMNMGLPFKWSEKSLAPIGLVAQEIIDPDKGIVGYMKTEKGEKAEALVGHLLEFSEKHPDLSLYQLFGSTMSSSKSKQNVTEDAGKLRAPLTRLRIFSELATRDLPIRRVELEQALIQDYPDEYREKDTAISKHLAELSRNGSLQYKASQPNGPYTFYKFPDALPDGQPSVYRGQVSLTQNVFASLRMFDQSVVSSQDVYEGLVERDPAIKDRSEKGVKAQIISILKHFEKEGFAEKAGDFSGDQQSEINLTDDQREAVTELMTIIEKFREGDSAFLQEGKRKAVAIASDPVRFASLLEKAKNASPGANRVDRSETADKLVALIRENPGSSRDDLRRLLLERHDQKLTSASVNHVLRIMKNEGWIEANEKGTAKHYSIAEAKAEQAPDTSTPFPPSGAVFEAK